MKENLEQYELSEIRASKDYYHHNQPQPAIIKELKSSETSPEFFSSKKKGFPELEIAQDFKKVPTPAIKPEKFRNIYLMGVVNSTRTKLESTPKFMTEE